MKSLEQALNSLLMVKIVIGMIIGIFIERNAQFGIIYSLIGLSLSTALIVLLYVNKKLRIKRKYNFLNGLSFMSTWIFYGMMMTAYHHVEVPDIEQFGDATKIGVVIEPTEEKAKSHKTRIRIVDTTTNKTTEILAYFEKDSLNPPPQFGDLIGFISPARYIENDGNPLEFNYKEYMARQGVYCQAYIKSSEYTILVTAFEKGIKYYGSKIRNYLIDIYKNTGISGQHLAILQALTLGYKADLEPETITAFQTSGAMHILAVSGLHTGIIMMITNLLLSPLGKKKKSRMIKCAIVIMILWTFAAITGFSPSVCRSALMFSLLAVSQVLNRRISTYNPLATSAFILLSINPLLIYNVGFGLSYLAVVAIISCEPLVHYLLPKFDPVHDTKWIWIKKWLTRYFLGLIFVSISAQIGTSILSIRTFNLFPTYFLLTNIIVIPLSYFIMVLAIVLLAVSWVGPLASIVTYTLKIFLGALSGSVSWIESLPMSSIDDIFITNVSAILLYGFFAMAVVFFHWHRAVHLKIALSLFLAFALSITIFGTAKNINEQVIIYNKNKTSLYSITSNNKMTIYAKSNKLDERSISPATINAELAQPNLVEICLVDTLSKIADLFYEIEGKKFYVVKSNKQIEIMHDQSLKTDFLIVSENTFINGNDITEKFSCANVIFDSSNSKKFIAARQDEYTKLGIKCHDVTTDGAFIFGDGKKIIWWF